MRQQIVCSAINGFGGYDVVTCTRNILESIGHSRCTGSNRQPCNTSFKGGNTLLEYSLCGIRQSAVDVPRLLQRKAGGCMCRVAEYIRSSLINRYGTRICSGVGLFLSCMKLQCLKM